MAETAITKYPVQDYLKNPAIVSRTEELLKSRAGQFLTSLMAAVNNISNLDQCVPATVYAAAITAASLDLPINNNLGFAYLIPYKNKAGHYEAQFQMGYKGFIQLAQRTGLYKQISATEVYEGQLISEDPLNGNTYNWKAKTSDDIIGYVGKFRLTNGFEHELYMPMEKMKAHGKRYSQSFKRSYGPWQDDFDVMAIKTVLKLLISKFGPLSVELQKAIERDQAIIKDNDKGELEYVDAAKDNTPEVKVGGSKLFLVPEKEEQAQNDTTAEIVTEKPKEPVKASKKAENKQPAQNDTPQLSADTMKILKSFKAIGVEQTVIENYIGTPAADWNAEMLADLKDIGKKLKEAGKEQIAEWVALYEKPSEDAEMLFGKAKKKEIITFGED